MIPEEGSTFRCQLVALVEADSQEEDDNESGPGLEAIRVGMVEHTIMGSFRYPNEDAAVAP